MRALAAAVMVGLAEAASAAEPAGLCHGDTFSAPENGVPAGMVLVPGGRFTMGEDDERPEERPAHRVEVAAFWIDRHEVTNAQFADFVAATGYVTVAERGLDPAENPGVPPELLRPGGMVFTAPEGVANGWDVTQWWRYVPGASWRAPSGPGSSIVGKEGHPVVQIAYEDALAYAAWRGTELPTEAQWEYAARGGLDGATYAWGDTFHDPAQGFKTNSWQGSFPVADTGEDGFKGTAPVGCFAPNGYGLYDMTGNVWEYTADRYLPYHRTGAHRSGTPSSEDGGSVVIKGGSWLCVPTFCARYRPSGRQPQELSLGSNHIGFRTVLDPGRRARHG
jgi:formylglycine-generating enzyme required for sulfatase activity